MIELHLHKEKEIPLREYFQGYECCLLTLNSHQFQTSQETILVIKATLTVNLEVVYITKILLMLSWSPLHKLKKVKHYKTDQLTVLKILTDESSVKWTKEVKSVRLAMDTAINRQQFSYISFL